LKEERVATLDGDWSEFTEAERAAFALALKLTYEPHLVGNSDLEGLRKHYKDLQVLEIVFTIAGNNSTNRWTEALGFRRRKRSGPCSARRASRERTCAAS
jgi:alkylhydroperoxidase family enzyme